MKAAVESFQRSCSVFDFESNKVPDVPMEKSQALTVDEQCKQKTFCEEHGRGVSQQGVEGNVGCAGRTQKLKVIAWVPTTVQKTKDAG